MGRFRLVYEPPRLRLKRRHKLNVFVEFYHKRTWTVEEVEAVDEQLCNGWWSSDGGIRQDWLDYDPEYLEGLGLPDLIDRLRDDIKVYLAIAGRGPFPTLRQIRQETLGPVREARNDRWYARLLCTQAERERCIRYAMPKRKTVPAQRKVEAVWIDDDRDIKRIRRVIERLKRADARVGDRHWRWRRQEDEQRPVKPLRMTH